MGHPLHRQWYDATDGAKLHTIGYYFEGTRKRAVFAVKRGFTEDVAKQKSIAQQLADSQKAIVEQLVATIKSDEAIIESAQVNLGYTNLTSPIDGVTGIRQIDIGNIIHPTDVNGLVDVTQIEPISLIFTLPEAEFVPVQERLSQGPITAFVDSQDGKQLDQGRLNLIDNQIIQTTKDRFK